MHLHVRCTAGPPPLYAGPVHVHVLIGRSDENRKCVQARRAVTCTVDAGNLGRRVNDHQANDIFTIFAEGTEVCATRIDDNGGWDMQLEVSCMETQAPVDEVLVRHDVPEDNCPKPHGDFRICSAWGDPHFSHVFYRDPDEGQGAHAHV